MPTGIRRSRRDAALEIAKQVPQKRAKKGDAEAEKPKMSKTQKFNNQFKEVCGLALGSPLPHLHRDWAHPCHICTTGTGPKLGLRAV